MEEVGTASTFSATINLAKVCIGSGILALPFATSLGGTFFSPLFLGVIAIWNAISVKLIIECKYVILKKYKDLLHLDVTNPLHFSSEENNVSQEKIKFASKLKKLSIYSLISYDSLGNFGLILTDWCIIITLLGVCIAYQITFASLFADIFTNYSTTFFLYLSFFLLLPLCYINNLHFLSYFSLLSLIFLILSIIIILYYGFSLYGESYINSYHSYHSSSSNSLSYFPTNIFNAAKFIGIATFCYGLSSMVFPIESSMKDKNNFMSSVIISLIFVWFLYVFIGNIGGVLYVYDEDHGGIKENILNNLPSNSVISNGVRFCMGFVVFFTYPLTFSSPADIIEGSIMNSSYGKFVNKIDSSLNNFIMRVRGYSPISVSSTTVSSIRMRSLEEDSQGSLLEEGEQIYLQNTLKVEDEEDSNEEIEDQIEVLGVHNQESSHIKNENFLFNILLRTFLVFSTTFLASNIPCFGTIISLLGCVTESMLSLVLPPLLHLTIISYKKKNFSYYFDIFLIVLAILITILTSSLTISDLVIKLNQGSVC